MSQSAINKTSRNKRIRLEIQLSGILQGIGFRPTVFRLASELNIGGWVLNSSDGVKMEIEGFTDCCELFIKRLREEIPSPGRIETYKESRLAPCNDYEFRIVESIGGKRGITPIPPDVAVCRHCLTDLFNPHNRRYLYPFTTCTLCGPRFSVVRSFPYDRSRTSMADFKMCPECEREYSNPFDRRFHSQTNSCSKCGPRLTLTDSTGTPICCDPIKGTIEYLRSGKIVAIKGIGGFHLACNALDFNAVDTLRTRKGRGEKPFAVMAKDISKAREFCRIDSIEEELLMSPLSPIVLLERGNRRAASNVAPGVGSLGLMLPYSPLHHLLFNYPEIDETDALELLVMTSANRSEEPIVKDNIEAFERLGDLVDAILYHDREIVQRADDSIFRVIAGKPVVIRRSRGLVPETLKVSPDSELFEPVILGTGGDLKNAPAIFMGGRIVPGPHVGDLASPIAQDFFGKSLSTLTEYLEATPKIAAIDPHPEYFSSNFSDQAGMETVRVYHHHAHAAGLLAEHGLDGPAIVATFDGTGFGVDGTIWGGEFLLCDLKNFTRVAFFAPFHLTGGESGIREPIRIAAGLLAHNFFLPQEFESLFEDHGKNVSYWLKAAAKGINSPMTSSAGRLFDAAAAVIGFKRKINYEGQAAMWLESLADTRELREYRYEILKSEVWQIDSHSLIRAVARDIMSGVSPGIVSAKFHNTIARVTVDILRELADKYSIQLIGISGGCFQNRLLTERIVKYLAGSDLTLLTHGSVPPNDGGLAIGQVVVALKTMNCRTEE